MVKIGIGQDSHKFKEGKQLVLGGITVENSPGLKANSDGDVVLHALCNALSSAVGKGSISTYADNLCLEKGIKDSKEYVKVALGFVKEASYKVNNISIVVEAKQPKLESYLPKMKKSIATLCNAETGITVTSGEGLTAFGRGEGIQAIAIVSLIKC